MWCVCERKRERERERVRERVSFTVCGTLIICGREDAVGVT